MSQVLFTRAVACGTVGQCSSGPPLGRVVTIDELGEIGMRMGEQLDLEHLGIFGDAYRIPLAPLL